jgi:hypothetical protein
MDQHIPQLTCLPGAENEFSIADKWYIDTYESGDWNGESGNLVSFFSDTPDTQAEIVAPASPSPITVYNSIWTDINNTGQTIDASDPSNTVINCIGITGPSSTGAFLLIFED